MATPDSSKQSWASGMTFYVVYVSLITAIGPLHFGFHLAELNAPQEVLTCGAKPSISKSLTLISHLRTSLVSKAPSLSGLPTCIPMNPTLFGLVSSIYTLGGLIGALSIGLLAGNFASPGPRANAGYLRSLTSKLPSPPSGRLAQMRLTTLCFVLGPLAEALAPSIWSLAIGRFISGIGSGAALVVVPIYISEVAPPSRKGLFGALTQVMTNVGILLAQVLGYFLSYGNMWRVVFAVAGAVGVAQALGLFFVPESPKWLAERGQVEKAKRILRRVRGRGVDVEEEVSGWDVGDQGQEEEEESLLRNPDSRPDPPGKPHPPKTPSPCSAPSCTPPTAAPSSPSSASWLPNNSAASTP
ncbi:MAG: MFS glucose [Lasallia pustulata]|uniref:MFS glucose n=1 Tax=Lasallia pustulata TaxID=136370 RepID=A0A5M8PTI2_9LECA|nr:MAG: MFS glucose [Lasallia pustulata]